MYLTQQPHDNDVNPTQKSHNNDTERFRHAMNEILSDHSVVVEFVVVKARNEMNTTYESEKIMI